jgi:hypothetical protein
MEIIAGMIVGIVVIGFALAASLNEFDNNKWKNKGY